MYNDLQWTLYNFNEGSNYYLKYPRDVGEEEDPYRWEGFIPGYSATQYRIEIGRVNSDQIYGGCNITIFNGYHPQFYPIYDETLGIRCFLYVFINKNIASGHNNQATFALKDVKSSTPNYYLALYIARQ